MDTQPEQTEEPKKRRTRIKEPVLEFVDTPKPPPAPEKPNQHDVIQVTAGEFVGVLAQIAEARPNGVYLCYVISTPSPPRTLFVKDGEFFHVGKAKKASRGPFQEPEDRSAQPNPADEE